jgi:thioredoxin reductase (NADPH)
MPSITMYTRSWCPYCTRAKELLASKGQTWTEVDLDAEPARREEMVARSGRTSVPQIFVGDRHVGGSDELLALERSGELDALLGAAPGGAAAAVVGKPVEHVRLLIVGSGPAGYTAAVYAARADLAPLLLGGLLSGGQLMLTTDVENYPGFPEGITGPELMERMRQQAERFGARVLAEDVTALQLGQRPFRAESDERVVLADAVILATGASARWLGLESEKRLQNRGVSACATCDGALFKGKPMAVVGGGDTALEEALFLTRYGTKVTIIHRRHEFRASKIMQDRALANPKIEVIWDSVVEEVLGDDAVRGVRTRNVKTGEVRDVPVEALFVAIGHEPSTGLLRGQLELDDVGYVKVESGSTRTSVEGVFACGDAMDPSYRQAVTAAGTGCMAAIDAERWLGEQGLG